MNYLNMALGAGMGAVGGALGGGRQQQGRPGERRDQGALMQYLRRKANPVSGGMPEGAGAGLPPGAMPPPGPLPPMAGAPPQQNPYQNPYPMRPPMEDPNAPMGPAYGQQFAQGGIVSEPTTAIIGEDGPEMVIPLSGRPDAKVSPRNAPRMSYGR